MSGIIPLSAILSNAQVSAEQQDFTPDQQSGDSGSNAQTPYAPEPSLPLYEPLENAFHFSYDNVILPSPNTPMPDLDTAFVLSLTSSPPTSPSFSEIPQPIPMPDFIQNPASGSVANSLPSFVPQPQPGSVPQPLPNSAPQPLPGSVPQSSPDSAPQLLTDSIPQPMSEVLLASVSGDAPETMSIVAPTTIPDLMLGTHLSTSPVEYQFPIHNPDAAVSSTVTQALPDSEIDTFTPLFAQSDEPPIPPQRTEEFIQVAIPMSIASENPNVLNDEQLFSPLRPALIPDSEPLQTINPNPKPVASAFTNYVELGDDIEPWLNHYNSKLSTPISQRAIGAESEIPPLLDKMVRLPYSLYLFGNVTIHSFDKQQKPIEFDIQEYDGKPFTKSALLRICEAIKITSIIHHLAAGGDGNFEAVTLPWYQNYVQYAIHNHIMKSTDFTDYTSNCTRAQLSYLFAACISKTPHHSLSVPALSDVCDSDPYAHSIFLLFRVGVFTTPYPYLSFRPDEPITRMEAAIYASRLVNSLYAK